MLNVLLWRKWSPLFDFPATYSCLAERCIGGTDIQLLWHARNLVEMGHRVQVLGATAGDVVELGVDFVGSRNKEDQTRLVETGRIRQPDLVLLEGALEAAPFFRTRYPSARIVHVGQNIDRLGDRAAFNLEPYVDAYAFVGPGQLANYSARFPKLRHKFVHLRNIVPLTWMYSQLDRPPVQDRVVWVGSWGKQGLRHWAQVMERVLDEFPTVHWSLFGPAYGREPQAFPPHIVAGLRLPAGRVTIDSVPVMQVAQEIGSAAVVLVSLGNECGPVSILDAHAMGRPVLSGNDMVYKYSNPEGTGIRVTTAKQGYQALSRLLQSEELRERLGATGKSFVMANFAEKNQRDDLEQILGHVRVAQQLEGVTFAAPSRLAEGARWQWSRVERKLLQLQALGERFWNPGRRTLDGESKTT